MQDLISQKEETIHVTRIRKYCGLLNGNEVPREVLDLANRTAAKYEIVENIVDIAQNEEDIWIHVQWDELPEERDFT